jgi:hypothetical protein
MRKLSSWRKFPEPVFLNLFKEPRNRFPARGAGTTTLSVVPDRQAAQAGEIDSSESIPVPVFVKV